MNKIFDMINLINSNEHETQREYAKSLNVSLGSANKIINEAIELGYITKENGYKVSSKGKILLEEHKVDNAIIMAAGFGSRFVPMTYDTPKGLLEVKGEVMIERQIRQLHEVGIKEIIVVIGYLKEKFEYLVDKFGVELVYNPDYSEMNNISSLYHAKDKFKNSYLLTSDIYMEENIYRPYEYHSHYAIEYYEDFTEEWKAEINKDNLILSLDPKGGSDCWAINGPVFLKEKESKKLLEEIDKIYDKKYAAQWYWEDVYMRHISEIEIHGRKYPLGTILEFESLEELREYDHSYYVDSRSDVLDTISKVFKVKFEDIKEIKMLKEGMTNDSFLFEVEGIRYVFRNPGVGTDKLINRFEEAEVYSKIKSLKISDDVIYLNPEKGYKITKFIHNARNLDFSNEDEIEKAFTVLHTLHNSGLKVDHEFNLREKISDYLNLCHDNNAVFFTDFDEIYEIINSILDALDENKEEVTLIHADFMSDNFLIDEDNNLTFLDWEYAGMGEWYIDIAANIVYEGLSEEAGYRFLDMYLKRDATSKEVWKLDCYISLMSFLWTLWTLYKEALGDDFGTYGMEQYAYAKKFGRKAFKEIEKYA